MRWKCVIVLPPEHGARRVKRRFLWWPLTIGSETRWLEWAEVAEVYWTCNGAGHCAPVEWWEAVEFVPEPAPGGIAYQRGIERVPGWDERGRFHGWRFIEKL